jgi:outer membrane immunogenic protein
MKIYIAGVDHMKCSLLLGIAIIGAGIGNAAAADFADTPVSDWTGFYGTLSAGYSGIGLDGTQVDFGTFSDKSWSDGAAFGLGLGYNHDIGDFVFGLDGDVSLLTNENQLEMKQTVDADYDWFATARVRAGYDADGTLLYATGGLAALGADFDDGADSESETFVGWTAGAGIEHIISDSFSIKVEALYTDFGSVDFTLSGDDTEIDSEMVLVRAGISFRF